MVQKIQQYLAEIEQEKNITILWACETGSRAWGFPSPNSDYDIRMIYVHKNDWYLKLTPPKDSIEIMLDNNNIDISGWELRKSLNLLRKSNAPLLERIQSPIVYQQDEAFIKDIRVVSSHCYSKIATVHHYLSMAKKFTEELKAAPRYPLKKFFYTLRSALVCKWILEKEEIPPIEFGNIYPSLSFPQHFVDRIQELIALKSTQPESYLHQEETALIQLIDSCILETESRKNTLPTSNVQVSELNFICQKYIKKYDH